MVLVKTDHSSTKLLKNVAEKLLAFVRVFLTGLLLIPTQYAIYLGIEGIRAEHFTPLVVLLWVSWAYWLAFDVPKIVSYLILRSDRNQAIASQVPIVREIRDLSSSEKLYLASFYLKDLKVNEFDVNDPIANLLSSKRLLKTGKENIERGKVEYIVVPEVWHLIKEHPWIVGSWEYMFGIAERNELSRKKDELVGLMSLFEDVREKLTEKQIYDLGLDFNLNLAPVSNSCSYGLGDSVKEKRG